jgi:hypothetical protein
MCATGDSAPPVALGGLKQLSDKSTTAHDKSWERRARHKQPRVGRRRAGE